MEQVMQNDGTLKAVSKYRAIVPTWRAPVITGLVSRQGEIFYKGANGKLYVPKLYDAMFKTVRGLVLGKYYKGINPVIKY